ncbi:hypothetical protein DesLBE_1518 [Desulfitobacterium sp. LBE]|uniref:hypothetical protein n=1 Tax=Desulfitobacterium sp. LBE TaxID=884086 RepID=UPI00037E239F|nr:hypothetical protein [Desulfitobacterium sp. LBE]TWH57250.1 hypothetical protein DesLBE_1518 [Desulfitobacterium sp. LBE]
MSLPDSNPDSNLASSQARLKGEQCFAANAIFPLVWHFPQEEEGIAKRFLTNILRYPLLHTTESMSKENS